MANVQLDYEKLRQILTRQYGREVSLVEASETGKFLLKIYDVLLSDEGNGKIIKHTAPR